MVAQQLHEVDGGLKQEEHILEVLVKVVDRGPAGKFESDCFKCFAVVSV